VRRQLKGLLRLLLVRRRLRLRLLGGRWLLLLPVLVLVRRRLRRRRLRGGHWQLGHLLRLCVRVHGGH
jgi:hypothetical protein